MEVDFYTRKNQMVAARFVKNNCTRRERTTDYRMVFLSLFLEIGENIKDKYHLHESIFLDFYFGGNPKTCLRLNFVVNLEFF